MLFAAVHMSLLGTERTFRNVSSAVVIGGKTDVALGLADSDKHDRCTDNQK